MAEESIIIKNTYRVVRAIKSGGMGTVYEVEHLKLGTVWALKQLKEQFGDHPEARERFRREAFSMARLRHNHIVEVIDYDIEPGFGAYYVMEFIVGADLVKIIQERGRLPYAEVLRIGSEVASALDYAYRKRGLVHRDIKPANILIEAATGRAVVTDFGIAKRTRHEEDESTDISLTETFVGTYRYSCPEQLRNEKNASPRWDIYSFGAVLYEMASGNRFLAGMSEGQILAHVAYMPGWTHPLDYPEPLAEEFRALVAACLQTDPEKRVGSAADLLARLTECQARCVAAPPVTPVATTPYVEGKASTSGEANFTAEYQDRIRKVREQVEGRLKELRALAAELSSHRGEQAKVPDVAGLSAGLLEAEALERNGQLGEALERLHRLARRAAEAQERATRGAQATVVAPTHFAKAEETVTVTTAARRPSLMSVPRAAAAALVLVLIAAGVFVATRSPEPRPPQRGAANAGPSFIDFAPPADAEASAAYTYAVRAADPEGDALTFSLPTAPAGMSIDPSSGRITWTPTDAQAVAAPHPVVVQVADATHRTSLNYQISVHGHPNSVVALASTPAPIEPTATAPPPRTVAEQQLAKIPPFQLEPRPRQLSSLRFNQSQRFELSVPAELRRSQIEYGWAVDGRKVSTDPALVFKNDDPALVRDAPIRLAVTARDERERSFSYEWKLKLLPPPPQITATSPPTEKPLEADAGSPMTFRLTAAPPVGSQTFTYVFETNGKETRSATPTYELAPVDGKEYTIVASVADNFGQRSPERKTWKVGTTSVLGVVQHWLQECREAFNRKDVSKLAELMQLDAARAKGLESALSNQENLKVSFNDVHVEKVDADQVRASYQRVDQFLDARSGKPISLSTPVQQTFRVVDGRVRLEAGAR